MQRLLSDMTRMPGAGYPCMCVLRLGVYVRIQDVSHKIRILNWNILAPSWDNNVGKLGCNQVIPQRSYGNMLISKDKEEGQICAMAASTAKAHARDALAQTRHHCLAGGQASLNPGTFLSQSPPASRIRSLEVRLKFMEETYMLALLAKGGGDPLGGADQTFPEISWLSVCLRLLAERRVPERGWMRL